MKQDELTQQLGKQTVATRKACQAILPLILGLKSKQEPFVDLPSHQRKFKLLSMQTFQSKNTKQIQKEYYQFWLQASSQPPCFCRLQPSLQD